MITFRHRGASILSGTALALTLLTLAVPDAARAHLNGWPLHKGQEPLCAPQPIPGYGFTYVDVYFPSYFQSLSGLTEWVAYRADLHRYNRDTGRWDLIDGTKPWVYTRVNSGVISPYVYSNGANAGGRFRWPDVTRGDYAVKHYFYWFSLGLWHPEWSTSSCRI